MTEPTAEPAKQNGDMRSTLRATMNVTTHCGEAASRAISDKILVEAVKTVGDTDDAGGSSGHGWARGVLDVVRVGNPGVGEFISDRSLPTKTGRAVGPFLQAL